MTTDAATTTISPAQATAARVAGAMYVLTMATSIVSEVAIRGALIVPGNVPETAKRVVESHNLMRLGLGLDIVTAVGVTVLVWALYVILRPVSKPGAALAAILRIVEAAVWSTSLVFAFAGLALLNRTVLATPDSTASLQEIGYTMLRVHGDGMGISFVFSGLGSAVFSLIWLRSGYIPKALAGWGIFSSLLLGLGTLGVLSFPSMRGIGMAHMAPMFFYEVGLGVWLLAKGLSSPVARPSTPANV
jgi:hypothetical protein